MQLIATRLYYISIGLTLQFRTTFSKSTWSQETSPNLALAVRSQCLQPRPSTICTMRSKQHLNGLTLMYGTLRSGVLPNFLRITIFMSTNCLTRELLHRQSRGGKIYWPQTRTRRSTTTPFWTKVPSAQGTRQRRPNYAALLYPRAEQVQ